MSLKQIVKTQIFYVIPIVITKKTPIEGTQMKIRRDSSLSLLKISEIQKKATNKEKWDKITIKHTENNFKMSILSPPQSVTTLNKNG